MSYRTAVASVLTWVVVIVLHAHATERSISSPQDPYQIGLDGDRWFLELAMPGFKVEAERSLPDGQGKMMQASNLATGLIMSVYVERVPVAASATSCRDLYWTEDLKSPIPKSDISLSEKDPFAFARWMVKEFQGQPVMQQNVKAFLGRDGVCVDIHVSKVAYQAADGKLFEDLLNAVKVRER